MPATPVLFGLLSASLTILGAVPGWLLARRSSRCGKLNCLIALGIVGLALALDHRPEWIIGMGGSMAYLWLGGLWVAWPGMLFLSAAIPMLPRKQTKWLVGIFAALFGSYFVCNSLLLASFRYETLNGTIANGFCRQSTSWSCGPAACVTLLAQLGVATDEATMALRCGTVPHRGTTDYGLWYGLRRSLPTESYRVRLVRPPWDHFHELPMPLVTSMKLTFLLNHAVCVLNADRESVTVANPLKPRPDRLSVASFRENWLKTAVIVEKIHPGFSPAAD